MTDDAMLLTKTRGKTLKRLGRSLGEFFAPRDWIPTIPIPRKCKGEGCMSLGDAIKGFPKKDERPSRVERW